MTWKGVMLSDGAAAPASATAVIYNQSQGAFYASIRRHGLYSSTDGQHFTRLNTQPGAGLASGLCPAVSNALSCLIYRGEFAGVPGRNEKSSNSMRSKPPGKAPMQDPRPVARSEEHTSA